MSVDTKQEIFSYFPNLPLEIRRIIWRVAARSRKRCIIKGELFPCMGFNDFRIEILAPKVSTIDVCRESRREAMAVYNRITYDDTGHCAYVDLSRDKVTLCPSWHSMPGWLFLFLETTNFIKGKKSCIDAYKRESLRAMTEHQAANTDLQRVIRELDQGRTMPMKLRRKDTHFYLSCRLGCPRSIFIST
jgi:hypothetical protein